MSACTHLETLCSEYELEILEQKEIPYGRQFKVRHGGSSAQFNVYFGKKGLNLVVQGSDNAVKKLVEQLFVRMQGGTSTEAVPASLAKKEGGAVWSAKQYPDVIFAYDEPWIGTDESGKDDFGVILYCTGC